MWPEATLQNTLKASLKDFDIPMGSLDRLHRSDQSATKELSMKERKSVKLKESAENANPRPMGLQQIP